MDFGAGDRINLTAVDVTHFDGYGTAAPSDGGWSIWQSGSSTFITWNTFDEWHDLEIANYAGDPYAQIIW